MHRQRLNRIWRCRMTFGVAVWHLALPDGHWRCRMTGRCRLSRGVARHPRALPWGVAVRHLALPGGTWRCRNASKARQVLGLGRAGLQPRTNTSSFLTFRDVLHEWSQFDVSVKNTIEVLLSQPQIDMRCQNFSARPAPCGPAIARVPCSSASLMPFSSVSDSVPQGSFGPRG